MKKFLVALALAPLCIGAAFATVNVNTAQQSELVRVKGIDKHKARAIITHRSENGPYDSLEDLEKLPGFTPEVVARVAPHIAFEGDAWTPPAKPSKEKDKDRKK
ncbi:MAG TPA: helix-hairpin-helix domain-containing protein [Usitatibacter sp.]|nr:helix-hairpin-helix domain-containing protein [Usitatibacter sp.]